MDEAVLTRLPGNTHPLARPEFDQGAAPPNLPMDRMLLVLKRSPEQESALQALLDQQHDKSSSNYHRWLNPDQFGQQFGPADQDIQAVTSWLQSHGFQVARVGRGRTAIEFSGTAARVRDAFRTEIHSYLVGGAQHWANGSDPQIPAALAPVVSGVAALHDFYSSPLHHLAGLFSREQATGQVRPIQSQATPQFTFMNSQCQPACYAVTPSDFATIYNVLPLWNANPAIDGSGQSIAIVGRSNINLSDIQDFRRLFGLPANDPEIILDGPDPFSIPGDETESDLDVEWAGAVAPNAAIKFVVSASTNTDDGIALSAIYAVENNVAPILSVSYGQCELHMGTAGNQFYSALWEQAAAQGITVLVASGDSGSAGCDRFRGLAPQSAKLGLAVSGFASTPFNVAVGGTDFMNFGPSFNINSPSPYWYATNSVNLLSAKGYIPETTWNNTCTNEGVSFLGFESNSEARCNDPQLNGLVVTLSGSGGRSSCTNSDGVNGPSCTGGYPSPVWQTTGLHDMTRDVPDVSLFASDGLLWNSFYAVCEADVTPGASCSPNMGGAFIGVGGTSAAAPAFAGIMALVNQFTNSAGQGNANYVLYKLPSLPAQAGLNCSSINPPDSRCIFNDVTFGTNAVPCAAGTPNCTIGNAGDSVGVLSGYAAGVGYDLATGLGSVNAFNLVQNWSNVTFQPTTTTLSLNGMNSGTVSLTHGQLAQVSITVKNPSGGIPTGDVSLVANSANGQGVDANRLSAGVANWSTSLLPGGIYSVHAHYAGDGTFGASDSGSITVNVAKEASRMTLSPLTFGSGTFVPLPANIPYGTMVYLQADVQPTAPPNPDTPPTGTVTFTDNYSGVQPAPILVPNTPSTLNSVGTTVAGNGNGLFALSLGKHSVSASYSGDNSYLGLNANSPITFTISQAPTQTSMSPSATAVAVNSTLTLTVAVKTNLGVDPLTGLWGGAALPTGTVRLFDGSTQIGSTTINNAVINTNQVGQSVVLITLFASALPFGTNNFTAEYSGDTNYTGSMSQALTVQVGYSTTTVLTSSNLTVPVSTNVTFTAQVTSSQSGGPAITGTAIFQIDPTASTTVPLVNGIAQFTTNFPSPGSHPITAKYSGDQNYIPSHAFLQEQVVVPDFTLSDSLGNTANIIIPAAGQSSAPVTLTVTGTNGYNGTIAFSPASCVITPAGSLSSCNFSPASVTGSGSTQLVINTTGPRAAGTLTGHFVLPGTKLQPITVCLLFLVTLTIFRKQRRLNLIFGSVILLALFGLWACGGGSSGGAATSANTIPGTPTGVPYAATINAAPSGENGHTISLTFTVQ